MMIKRTVFNALHECRKLITARASLRFNLKMWFR